MRKNNPQGYCSLSLKFLFRHLSLSLIISALILNSCVPSGSSARSKREGSENESTGDSANPSDGKGSGAGPSDGSIDTEGTLTTGRAELRHIIDPFSGHYKTKITIPKNFKGFLHLSGLNISSLSDKLIKVRFRFGRDREEIIIPAYIGRASGIIPQTDVQVLTMDMQDKPFKDLRLNYDLYDYNDYDTNNDGTEFGNDDDQGEPTTDPRDIGLFCRGLRLEDDPTFSISSTNDRCDSAGEICKYTYARIADSGLTYLDNSNLLAITPSEPQIDVQGDGYSNQDQVELLKKCLPDVDHRQSVQEVLNTIMSSSSSTQVAYGDGAYDGDFVYLGPYRALSRSLWEISGDAVFSDISSGAEPSGLFQSYLNNAPTNTSSAPNARSEAGIKSFLFPRAGRYDLSPNVEYIGYTNITDAFEAPRSIRSLVAAGETEFMDGCNLRISNFNEDTNETISSCNITATIDLISTDPDTNEVETLNTTKQIKLQITRASDSDFEGNEVRFSALRNCSSESVCASDECCFNERCWSKDIVSQCIDDGNDTGNLGIGQACNSDYQCSSLCCNSATGSCAVHNPLEENFCSKSPGQQCVTKEFCRQENIPTCFIVKDGVTNQGQTTCSLRCYNVPTFGDCNGDGICIPPTAPPVPDFDPTDPDACLDAIDPPTTF